MAVASGMNIIVAGLVSGFCYQIMTDYVPRFLLIARALRFPGIPKRYLQIGALSIPSKSAKHFASGELPESKYLYIGALSIPSKSAAFSGGRE